MPSSNRDLTSKENVLEFLEQQDIFKYFKVDLKFETAICDFLSKKNESFEINNINQQLILVANHISAIECELAELGDSGSTICNKSLRNKKYRSDAVRKELHAIIKKSCLSKNILADETSIDIDHGGMVPNSGSTLKEGKMFLLIGGPASGKSSYANRIADFYGAYLVDSDIIKRKLPEFADKEYSASLLHDESSLIQEEILELIISAKRNVVVPTIGKSYKKLREMINLYSEKGYDVSIILFNVEKGQAMLRALKRFLETGRYVPLSYVYDTCGHESVASFYRVAAEDRERKMLSIDNNTNSERKGKIEFAQCSDDIVKIIADKIIWIKLKKWYGSSNI